jgi:anti-sigma factor RsiW
MACGTFEPRILEYLDHQLGPADLAVVQAHLAVCPDCRAFADQLRNLDSALARHWRRPTLSETFTERLYERIGRERAPVREPERAERRRELQAEFDSARSRLRWGSVPTLFAGIGGAVLIGLVGLFLGEVAPALVNHVPQDSWTVAGTWLLSSLIASASFLAIGVRTAFPKTFHMLLD